MDNLINFKFDWMSKKIICQATFIQKKTQDFSISDVDHFRFTSNFSKLAWFHHTKKINLQQLILYRRSGRSTSDRSGTGTRWDTSGTRGTGSRRTGTRRGEWGPSAICSSGSRIPPRNICKSWIFAKIDFGADIFTVHFRVSFIYAAFHEFRVDRKWSSI